VTVTSAAGVDVSEIRAKPLDETARVSEAKENTSTAETMVVSLVDDAL
jgi:hypothetical protein